MRHLFDTVRACPHAALGVLSMFALASGASASFQPLGVLDAGTQYPLSFGVGMTPDGQTIVGYSNVDYTDNVGTTLSYAQAFRWTTGDGMTALGSPSQFLAGSAGARLSADGSIVVGTSGFSLKGNYEPRNGAYWTEANTASPVAHQVEEAYFISDLSRDGATFIGTTRVTGVPFPILDSAFIWNRQGGSIQELGTLPGGSYSIGNAVSADGATIVGSGDSNAGFIQAWRWTSAQGIQPIPGIAGDQPSEAFDISGDATTIVGHTNNQLFRFNETQGLTIIPTPENSFVLNSVDVRFDGGMIVGTLNLEDGSFQPFIWSDDLGMRDLSQYLTSDLGMDLAGYTLLTAGAVSDDGRVIAGTAFSPEGMLEAYRVTIPAPGAGALLAMGLLAHPRRRR